MNPTEPVADPTDDASYLRQLLGDFTHEVCGSIHTIQGFTDLVLERTEDEESSRLLRTVGFVAQRLTTLAEALKFDDRDEHRPVEPVDLALVVRRAQDRSASQLHARGLNMRCHLGSTPPVIAEPELLDAIVDVVIVHAITHSPRGSDLTITGSTGSGDVTLTVTAPDPAPSRLVRYVLAHLCHRAGVGLSLEPHDRRTITRLRLARVSADPDQIEEQITVLHVEDDAATRELVEVILSTEGIATISAGSVAEAEAVLRTHAPDLVVVDQRLGDELGIEFVRSLRSRSDHSSTPVLMVSADHDSALEGRAHNLGVLLVHKPVTNEALLAAIHTALGAYL